MSNTAGGEQPLGIAVPINDPHEPQGSLQPLLDLAAGSMAAIDRIILDRALSEVEMIPALAHHLISSGGKRLRPMLTVATAKLCGYGGTGHLPVAAAIEFLHTATLLHDDVVDGSDVRRGQKAARTIWGNPASVLVGDFLLGQTFRMLVEVGSLPVLRIVSNAAAVIAEGEVMQLAAAKNIAISEEEYLAIVDAKTAALFLAAAEVGAALADRPAEEQALLRTFGRNLGLSFQLVDDALDYSGDSAKLGKAVGNDFHEGKVTLPVIVAYRHGSDGERAFWRRTIAEGEKKPDDLEKAIALVKKHGGISATVERARRFAACARQAIEAFPASSERQALEEAVAFCVNRTH